MEAAGYKDTVPVYCMLAKILGCSATGQGELRRRVDRDERVFVFGLA